MINVYDDARSVTHTNVHSDGRTEYIDTKTETSRTASTTQFRTAGHLRALVRALDAAEAPDSAQLHIEQTAAGPIGFRVTWTPDRADAWAERAKDTK